MKKKIKLLLMTILLIIPNVVKASPYCPYTVYDRIVTNPNDMIFTAQYIVIMSVVQNMKKMENAVNIKKS